MGARLRRSAAWLGEAVKIVRTHPGVRTPAVFWPRSSPGPRFHLARVSPGTTESAQVQQMGGEQSEGDEHQADNGDAAGGPGEHQHAGDDGG